MSSHNYMDYDGPELPPEAGDDSKHPFDPDDEWIASAPRALQVEAMRRWFYARYQDPANETPYDSEDSCYIFMWGGPYDPNEEIQERFAHVVEYDVMEELINDLYREVGDEWAPIDYEVDYDDALSMLVRHRYDPARMLLDRLAQIEAVLTVQGSAQAQELAIQLAHGATITALESYLWDTVSYWTSNDRDVLKDFVSTNTEFGKEKIPLSSIFKEYEEISDKFNAYLQDLVWHRLDKIKPMMEQGLNIKIPDIGSLMEQVIIRHDIIHRGGRDKDGHPISVTIEQVRGLAKMIESFSTAIEEQLQQRFPEPPSLLSLNLPF